MDNEDKTVLVNLWLEKSRNEFKSAKENLQTENFSTVINRSYYCVFYSIRALLTLHELKNKKHKSDIRLFHKLYIHTGIFPRELYQILLEMESQRENLITIPCTLPWKKRNSSTSTLRRFSTPWKRI